MTTGRVLRIDKLSTFDGDGLRTVVFLKGCPLRCSWCSTPESHRFATDFGVKKEKCINCFFCVEACPQAAISYDRETEVFTTDSNLCVDCGKCVQVCPANARIAHGRTSEVDEVIDEVQRDSIFYFHSGGGLTVSGGEPLMQTDFVVPLLRGCQQLGTHTAMETCGHAPWEAVARVLPHLDALYYDLKHMNSTTHKEITGVGNELILENLLKIDESNHPIPVTVRVPLIPTINDSDENIAELGWFCKKLNKLDEIHILPYHRLGLETYHQLSIDYPLGDLPPQTSEELEHKVAILTRMGLKAKVGG